MKKNDPKGLSLFLENYPWMTIEPSKGPNLILGGQFKFIANTKNGPEIEDSYQIEISVPDSFPKDIPRVKETGGKIPRDGHHHVNPDDSLCLGSPLNLLRKINISPTLPDFANKCLVPFLYAISHKRIYGGKFIFDELPHGVQGILYDYRELMGLESNDQVIKAIKLIGMKKRIANKKNCPCDCGKRLGICQTHNKLNKFRKLAPRSWFTRHAKTIEDERKGWRIN